MTKTWQEEKIKHTAEHISIISEGALKTLVTEIRQQDMEKLIKKVSFGLECFSDGGHRYQDKIAELIKDYYKQ